MWPTRLSSAWPLARGIRFMSSSRGGVSISSTSKGHQARLLDSWEEGRVRPQDINLRLSDLHVTASALAGLTLNQIELELPSVIPKDPLTCPSNPRRAHIESLIVPQAQSDKEILDPRAGDKVIEDPRPSIPLSKYAQRMVRIRRRKMKVHQRRRRNKRNFTKYKKTKDYHRRLKECNFRMELLGKVKRAKKFDAAKYVEEYLDDLHTPKKLLTYKGKRLPLEIVTELYKQDELMKARQESLTRDIVTQEKLVQPGETVQAFEERMRKERDV